MNHLNRFNEHFRLGSLKSGYGKFRFFGTNVIQNDDYSIITFANDKNDAIFEYSDSHTRRKAQESDLNTVDKRAFVSKNSSLGRINTNASPLCCLYPSLLHQKATGMKVRHLIEQSNVLRKLKKFGSTICYPRLPLNVELPIYIALFADESRTDHSGEIGVMAELIFG